MVVTSGHVVGVRLQKSSTNPLGCKISHQNKTTRRRFVFIYIVDLSKKKKG
jgi:ribosomal protein L28